MTICENIEYYTDFFDAQNGDIGLKNNLFRNEITGISYGYLGLTPLSHLPIIMYYPGRCPGVALGWYVMPFQGLEMDYPKYIILDYDLP